MRGRHPNPKDATHVKASTKPPKPPPCLPAEARKEWRRLAPILTRQGLLDGERDRTTFAAYCAAWQMVRDALAALQAEGMTYRAGELRKRNPAAAQLDQAIKTLFNAGAQFGLTPTSRNRLGIVLDQTEEDPLAKFLTHLDANDTGDSLRVGYGPGDVVHRIR